MKRYSLLVFTLGFLLLGSLPALSSEVLMLTWNGPMFVEKIFEKHLKKLRPDVTFKYISAERSKRKLAEALRKTDMSKVDLVYSSGTNGTKIVKSFLKKQKPHVFNIVSTPVSSKIVNSVEKPGENITGAQLLVNTSDQFDIILKLKKIKKMGIWFDPREKHNASVLNHIKSIAEKNNIEILPFRLIPDAGNFDSQLKVISEKVNKLDALYVSSSYSFYVNARKIHKYLSPSLLVVHSLKRYIEVGGTLAVSADLGERSRASADLANKVLDGAVAGDLAIDVVKPEKIYLYVNKEKMEKAGLKDLSRFSNNVVYVDRIEATKK